MDVELLEGQGQALWAPVEGRMSRTIRESLRAAVRYRFWAGDRLLTITQTSPPASSSAGRRHKGKKRRPGRRLLAFDRVLFVL